MELIETIKTISILLIAPIVTAILYKTYKKPKEIAELIKAKDDLHKEVVSMHLNNYKNLENKYSDLLNANKKLKEKLKELSIYLQVLPELKALQNSDYNFKHILNRFITVYKICKKDGRANKSIEGYYFIGRVGCHASIVEQEQFEKLGFIRVDKAKDEILITERGKIFGKYYPDKFN